MARRPQHLLRWLAIGGFGLAFVAQCAVENWPKPAPVPLGTSAQRVVDQPGYSSDGSLEHPSAADQSEVTALLDRRARAVLSGNRAAFLDTVDSADAPFLASQSVQFTNMEQLPLEHLGYQLEGIVYPDAPLHVPSYVAAVTISYQLKGYDSAATTVGDGYTFVKQEGQWRLDSTSDADRQIGQRNLPPPWDGSGISVWGDGDCLAVVDKGALPLARRLVALCHGDAVASHDLLGVNDDAPAVLLATTSRHGFDTFAGDNAAAVTFADYDNANHIVGWRIKVNPGYLTEVMRDPVVLTHELTHFATQQYLATSPKWLSEGTAEFVAWHAHGGVASAYVDHSWRPLSPPTATLPISPGFYLNDEDESYVESQALIAYIVTTYGSDAPYRLFKAYQEVDAPTDDVDTATPHILATVLHTNESSLARAAYALIPFSGSGTAG